jgi:hypothetical protein
LSRICCHQDGVPGKLQAPLADGAQIGQKTQTQDDGIQFQGSLLAGAVVKHGRGGDAILSMDGLQFVEAEYITGGEQNLFDGLLVGAEGAPAMDEGDLGSSIQQVMGPIQGGVAAADDQHALSAKHLQVFDEIVKPLALHAFDIG